ncbi:MAG: ABC transporter permease [Planctomycetota bacterium]
MSGHRPTATLFALALDGLRRRPGRTLLTMSGVGIGVLALVLIVSLGEGMQGLIQTTLSGEANLRQIGFSAGFGARQRDPADVRIEGEMPEAKRTRLRRAAIARAHPGTFIGRRPRPLDARALSEVAALPHVESVEPIVLERYRVRCGRHRTRATATLGVDARAHRYAERLVAGSYFTAPDAPEVLVHEYLAWQWGFVTPADLEALVGRTVTLEGLGEDERSGAFMPGFVLAFMDRVDLDTLTEEELDLLPGMIEKLVRSSWGLGPGPARGGADEPTRRFRVVGVVRGLEPGDPFRAIEDGNALQADLFLPRPQATALYLASPVNRELGFARAFATVDDAGHAPEVETRLREMGYTAFSVASVTSRIEDFLGALTIVVSFLTGIALLVAALGIVNTMVTSVLERTREIGLWKAVGATAGQIRRVFLLEAGLIGFVGGLVGLGLALLLMMPLEHAAARLIEARSPVPLTGSVFRLPFWLPPAAVSIATAVAMLASIHPAHRAARVDPVRALHHE